MEGSGPCLSGLTWALEEMTPVLMIGVAAGAPVILELVPPVEAGSECELSKVEFGNEGLVRLTMLLVGKVEGGPQDGIKGGVSESGSQPEDGPVKSFRHIPLVVGKSCNLSDVSGHMVCDG